MKSKDLKSYNLPNDIAENTIDAKPLGLICVVFVIGVILVFPFKYYLLGIILLFFALLCFVALPSYKLIEFHSLYLVIFNKANHQDCTMIYYDEIASWDYKRGVNYDELTIELIDGTIEKIDAFSKILFESLLNVYCKEKRKKHKK